MSNRSNLRTRKHPPRAIDPPPGGGGAKPGVEATGLESSKQAPGKVPAAESSFGPFFASRLGPSGGFWWPARAGLVCALWG